MSRQLRRRKRPPRKHPAFPPGVTVVVRRRVQDEEKAWYRLTDVGDLHQTVGPSPAGGAGVPLIRGYVRCDAALVGRVRHGCTHGPAPHRIGVVMHPDDNPAEVYSLLLAIAGRRPAPGGTTPA